jgi:hypothetical protein
MHEFLLDAGIKKCQGSLRTSGRVVKWGAE